MSRDRKGDDWRHSGGESIVYFCTICKNGWENYWISKLYKLIKYPDFPSYGLERKQCPECKEVPVAG